MFSSILTECIHLYLIKLSSMLNITVEWVVVFYLVSNSCPLSKHSERKVRYLLISVSQVYLPITFKLNDHVSVTINQGLNMHSDYKILFALECYLEVNNLVEVDNLKSVLNGLECF